MYLEVVPTNTLIYMLHCNLFAAKNTNEQKKESLVPFWSGSTRRKEDGGMQRRNV